MHNQNQLEQPGVHDDGEYWSSVSDLMSGLMIVFVFIAVAYITNVAFTYQSLKDDLHNALETEFKQDLKKWNAELDKENLTIRFNEPEVLFERGEHNLKYKFRNILKDFFPRYIQVLTKEKFKTEIADVRIEGHTSSEWQGLTGLEAYIKNMELSQDRTRSVLGYVLNLNAVQIHTDWIKRNVTANGLSSSDLVFKSDSTEDKVRSRRVEFQVRTNAEKKLKSIIYQDENSP